MALMNVEFPNTVEVAHNYTEDVENFEVPMIDEIQPLFTVGYTEEKPYSLELTSGVIDLWENREFWDMLEVVGPTTINYGKIRTRETAQRLITDSKLSLTKYPRWARPVFTKQALTEVREIATRLYSVKTLRKKILNPNIEILEFCDVYFKPNWRTTINSYQDKPICYDFNKTIQWLEEHPDSTTKASKLIKYIQENLTNSPINDVNVNLKLESLVKAEPFESWEEGSTRLICWQNYAVAALFSPIFLEIKNRLKNLLDPKIIYTDGMTPKEINHYLNQFTGVKFFMEDDLEKQDRQTDKPVIEIEFKLYKMLGVVDNVLELYKTIHDKYGWTTRYSKGNLSDQRTSGSCTTAIGNVTTNMQVHQKFVKKYKKILSFLAMLGDDNSSGLEEWVNVKDMQKLIEVCYNMVSKASLNKFGATFCHYLMFNNEFGNVCYGPDVVRLERRFELNNKGSVIDDIALHARNMSYCATLGNLPGVRKVIEKWNYPIKVDNWYNVPACRIATMNKYEMNEYEVDNHLHNLTEMMMKMEITKYDFTMYTSAWK